MSTREKAAKLFDSLSEEQLEEMIFLYHDLVDAGLSDDEFNARLKQKYDDMISGRVNVKAQVRKIIEQTGS